MTDKSNAYQWRWCEATSAWGKMPLCSPTKRMVGTGQVYAGECYFNWISYNPSGPAAVIDITDAIAAGGDVVYDIVMATKDSRHYRIEPVMHFATGIYLETFANLTSVTISYTPI